MIVIFPWLSTSPFLKFPDDLIGTLGLILFFGVIAWSARILWKPPFFKDRRQMLIWLGLMVSSILFVLIFSIMLPHWEVLPAPNIPQAYTQPVILLFSAIPWVLAAGLLSPIPTLLVAGLGGFTLAFVGTHSLFTICEWIILAIIFSWFIRQPYSHKLFRVLRQPIGSATGLMLVYIPTSILLFLFSTSGSIAVRIDYALTQSWLFILCRAVEVGFAALIATVVMKRRGSGWIRINRLIASPVEKSLEVRLTFVAAAVVIVLFVTVLVSNWFVAGNNAKRAVESQLQQSALITAQALPYFLDAGQSLLPAIGKPEIAGYSSSRLESYLSDQIRAFPYFRQVYYFNNTGKGVGGYPIRKIEDFLLQPSEETAIQLALKGVELQTYVVPPTVDGMAAQISFVALVRDAQKKPLGVLLGRTDLSTNPFTQSAMQAFSAIKAMGGQGGIIDENGRWLYHTTPELVMSRRQGSLPVIEGSQEGISTTGAREYSYVLPVASRPWTIIVSIPAQQAQETTLRNSIPLLIVLTILSAAIFLAIRFSLQSFVRNIRALEVEATSISRGQLASPVKVIGIDEVGRLGDAFEKMRVSLLDRLEELNRLLEVSRSASAHLDITQAVQPILDASLVSGAASARLVLVRDEVWGNDQTADFTIGSGERHPDYAYLDQQIYEYISEQEILTLPNTSRVRRIRFNPARRPGAIIALPVRHESHYFGTLWIGYERPHIFVEEEVRYLSTLAGQAALAAANARLYAGAEAGRQRMDAVLSSTPEPVMMFDKQGHLLYINPAALQVAGLIASDTIGSDLSEVIIPPALIGYMQEPDLSRTTSHEVTLGDGRVYIAVISPVTSADESVGRICLLQDVTLYKEVDQMKSDFVSTVSHDLRSPLQLIQGYTSMLQAVGELSEQQKGYLQKIATGVDAMSHLVSDLLDLGRIESGVDLKKEPIHPKEIIESVIEAMQPIAIQKKISIQMEYDDIAGRDLYADSALIRQALINLTENAVRYSKMSGQVIISYHSEGENAIFSVKDFGSGISPIDMPHIYDKFHRLSSRDRRKDNGTGLGLAIVKSIAKWHHGDTWAESQLGKGSTFYLKIPLSGNSE